MTVPKATPGYLPPMNGLLASLRFPVALRGLRAAIAPVPAIAAPARTSDPFRTLTNPEATPRGYGTLEAPSLAHPDVAGGATPGAAAPAPMPALPVEPSVRVSAAHLVDPLGLRVVPFRPSTRWPLRRAAPRITDPFRGFPLRSLHLADLMDERPAER